MANAPSGIERIGAASADFAQKHIQGYPDVARFMAITAPQAAHVRSFQSDSMLLILYLQTDIEDLERRLHELQLADSNTSEGKDYAANWIQLRDSKGEQEKLVEKLREKLKTYQKSILLHRAMYPRVVNGSQLRSFQRYFDEKCGRSLVGPDACNWGSTSDHDGIAEDLLALHPDPGQTIISKLVADVLAPMFHQMNPFRPKAADPNGFSIVDGNLLLSLGRLLVLVITVMVNLLCLYSLCHCERVITRFEVAAAWFLGFAGCVGLVIGDPTSLSLITVITGFMAVVAPLIMSGINNGIIKEGGGRSSALPELEVALATASPRFEGNQAAKCGGSLALAEHSWLGSLGPQPSTRSSRHGTPPFIHGGTATMA
ncbi:hypothetical protein BU16DRAFT_536784 [Lophium mytilinum]|uniref:DUF6594 domain-containing protein n=1 Tax=Lophium mytilinum TaxID=390894 RepID=A0A6A6R4C2_9PEZI|nr:hypothetical protein BU16DRAFT_536784 [Lophium mytilinum]